MYRQTNVPRNNVPSLTFYSLMTFKRLNKKILLYSKFVTPVKNLTCLTHLIFFLCYNETNHYTKYRTLNITPSCKSNFNFIFSNSSHRLYNKTLGEMPLYPKHHCCPLKQIEIEYWFRYNFSVNEFYKLHISFPYKSLMQSCFPPFNACIFLNQGKNHKTYSLPIQPSQSIFSNSNSRHTVNQSTTDSLFLHKHFYGFIKFGIQNNCY